jgi:hypothetical protein
VCVVQGELESRSARSGEEAAQQERLRAEKELRAKWEAERAQLEQVRDGQLTLV